MIKSLPDINYLHSILRFDYLTGKLFWRERPPEHFKTLRACGMWNSRFAGIESGTLNYAGYLTINLNGKLSKVHRIIYFMHNNEADQKLQIDHINGIKSDNRLENLRLVTSQENSKNQKRRSTNTSGVTGVHWHNGKKKWRACITVKRKQKYLGAFIDKKDAIAVRQAAEVKYNFHENHGRC